LQEPGCEAILLAVLESAAEQQSCSTLRIHQHAGSNRPILQERVPRQWLLWQLKVLQGTFLPLHKLLQRLGLAAHAGISVEAASKACGLDVAGTGAGASSSSSSSQSQPGQVRCGYLLQQLQRSNEWAAAVADFDSKWRSALLLLESAQQEDSSAENAVDVGELYADALGLCKALVVAAPLPLVCNNPGCENFAGVSEDAVAIKSCASCRCRYCSAACQAAYWRRHRPGCKAMAAAGLVCK
jgi:hypothetical protein